MTEEARHPNEEREQVAQGNQPKEAKSLPIAQDFHAYHERYQEAKREHDSQ